MIRHLVVASLLAVPAPAAEEVGVAVAQPAVVSVTVKWHGWVRDKQTGEVFGGTKGYSATTTCGGAVINPDGYVVTASHCVHSGHEGGSGTLFRSAISELSRIGRIGNQAKARQAFTERAVAEGAAPDRPLSRTVSVELSGEDSVPATVVDLVAPDGGDVAVLKVARNRLPSVELRSDRASTGTPVLAVTPRGSRGGRITSDKAPFYTVTTGTPGSPVVDLDGRVVGVMSRGLRASDTSVLLGLLRLKNIQPALGAHDRNYRTGLDRYFAGNLDSAVDYFDATLAGSPSHTHATDFRDKASAQGGSPTSGHDRRVLLAYIFGGVTLVALGLGIPLMRRRRISAGSAPPAPPRPDPTP